MKKSKAILATLLVLCIIFMAGGCKPGTEPGGDPGTDDPGPEPSDDPGEDHDPESGDEPAPDPLAVTPVPEDSIDLIDKAVIHLGDLWLGASGQFWRQTDSGDVTEIVWAPNGYGLVYFRDSYPNKLGQELYYLALGEAPVLLDKEVSASYAWNNKDSWLWNPDSDFVAYAVGSGSEIVTVWMEDLSKTKLSLNKPCNLGPYWLSPGLLVYSTDAERPEVVVVNAIGQVQGGIADASLPYPLPEGLIVATGVYDPDGAMDTFYYTGLSIANDDGSGLAQIYDIFNILHMDRDPVIPNSIGLPRYIALSDPENLFLQKYTGLISKGVPNRVDLLSQDMYLTYSEFAYPLWFSWAPDGQWIAALRYTATQTGNNNETGYWDLVLVNEKAVQELLLEKLYIVKSQEKPAPFQGRLPLNWSQHSDYVNYLRDRKDGKGHDWWQVNVKTGAAALVLEESGLPEYRPQP